MFEKILHLKISLWAAILIILIVTGIAGGAFYYFRENIYNYNLFTSIGENKYSTLEYGSKPALSNPDFFKITLSDFVSQNLSFIEADLSTMKLRVYQNGSMVKEVPIIAKGKEGTYWETPAGIYKIEDKHKNHFSSFGKVYMDWNMIFQGNFFIHGWPYYPNGKQVESQYSGGCIRLSDEDAKAIYDLVNVGTPVLVYEKDFENDDFNYSEKLPSLKALSYLAVDLKNNFVFIEKSSKDQFSIESITKLLNILVATEYLNLEKDVIVTKDMLIETAYPRLKVGQKISFFDLFYLILMESSNEATAVISHYIGDQKLVDLINEKAKAVGMKNSKFVDVFGKSPDNISTAEDLFNLIKYIYNNRSFIFEITSGRANIELYGQSMFSDLKNLVGFIGGPEFLGGKPSAEKGIRGSMISIFEIQSKNEKRPIAIIVLNSQYYSKDILDILGYIKNSYSD